MDKERILIKANLVAKSKNEKEIIAGENEFAYILDCNLTEELIERGKAREVITRI